MRNAGSRSIGSTRPSNVRRGSTADITAVPESSVPSLRTTPLAEPSFTSTRSTSTSVLISAPASVAASAIARVTAPGPPTAVTPLPPGTGSDAAASRRTAAEPADHGPMEVPKIPRVATAPCRRSDSNHSATRSAAGIGPHRSRLKASFLPSARNRRPVFNSVHSSPVDGASIDGGVISSSVSRKPPSLVNVAQTSGYFPASAAENGRIASAVR